MINISEAAIEAHCLELLQRQGYEHIPPEQQEEERDGDFSQVILRRRAQDAINKLNPDIPAETREYALRELLHLAEPDLISANEKFHRFFIDGMDVEYQKNGETIGDNLRLVDFDAPENNDFAVCAQFSVRGEKTTRRPDIVLFINGFPVAVIELKNPTAENVNLESAYNQLQTYMTDIPALFQYNALLVLSDGPDTKIGAMTANYHRFAAWKDDGKPARIETLADSLFRPAALLDYLRHFVIFEKSAAGKSKKIAACHQVRAVNQAVEKTKTATRTGGDGKIGIIWHAQGSGKSLSMVFYAGKIVLELDNPTIVVITDRNDLDGQLFGTFAANRPLLREPPQQADSRDHLQQLLRTAGGGIVFSTLQKFLPEQTGGKFPLLSSRHNIVVIADEAHRSHYGFAAKTNFGKDGAPSVSYGFAKHLRDALPSASFIGFTATPVEKEDTSTRAVFGDEIDIYDMQESVEDGATVPIYYESRLAKMDLDDAAREQMDEEVDALISPGEEEAAEKAKRRFATYEAVVGNEKRIKAVAKDIVAHFEKRHDGTDGKAMVVAMSRRIAVLLYEQLKTIRPQWHDEDKGKGALKIVMTAAAGDPQKWQQHRTTKQERQNLGERLKNPDDPLKIAIVCDMWLTGFDAPCLHTMYVDKPMHGHNLMQAIARVNRVYSGKDGGLVVDYIGFALDLQKAVKTYTAGGGKGAPVLEQEEAIEKMHEQYEIVAQMFHNFDYKRYFGADTGEKITILLDAQEHILSLEDGKNRYYKHVGLLSRAYALALPSEPALAIREEVAFFLAVKSRIAKLEPSGSKKSEAEFEEALRKIVSKAFIAGDVVDIFDASGLQKPDVAVLSDEFLEQVKNMKRKNLALELLKKLLNDEIRMQEKSNIIQAKKLSEMLQEALNKYQNKLLTAAQIINELIDMAKNVRQATERGKKLGMSAEELAFYDALADNDSARDLMEDEQLFSLAQVLVEKVKANATIDWRIRESVRAKMQVTIKGILKKYGYPPDMEKLATENILKQAELFAKEWSE